MNKPDAYVLLSSELESYRQLGYDGLVPFIGTPVFSTTRASDSTPYALQITVRWEKEACGEIRVDGWIAVDDCGPLHRLDDCVIVRRR